MIGNQKHDKHALPPPKKRKEMRFPRDRRRRRERLKKKYARPKYCSNKKIKQPPRNQRAQRRKGWRQGSHKFATNASQGSIGHLAALRWRAKRKQNIGSYQSLMSRCLLFIHRTTWADQNETTAGAERPRGARFLPLQVPETERERAGNKYSHRKKKKKNHHHARRELRERVGPTFCPVNGNLGETR